MKTTAFRNLCIFILPLCFTLFSLSACQKENSYELPVDEGTGNSSSGFELVPSGSNCSDAVASGSFVAGTKLTASSFITVTVNVKTTGSWTFSTKTVNGFSFTGSGNFTQTGNQSIQLTAKGTPKNAENSTFDLKVGSAVCSIAIPVLAAGFDDISNASSYYKATIDGVYYVQKTTSSNGYMDGSGLAGSDDVAFSAGIDYDEYSGIPKAPGSTELDVEIGVLHNYYRCTDSYFRAFFTLGDHPYVPGTLDKYSYDGVTIDWYDASGAMWTSQTETSDQTGSTFKIISVEDSRDLTGTLFLKVKMQFSCKLYNYNTGAVKHLTNGEMVAYFGKI